MKQIFDGFYEISKKRLIFANRVRRRRDRVSLDDLLRHADAPAEVEDEDDEREDEDLAGLLSGPKSRPGRALAIQQSCRGSFSALSTQIVCKEKVSYCTNVQH